MSCPHGLFDVCCNDEDDCALGLSPKREWVGLTFDEIKAACSGIPDEALDMVEVARAIEAKLKEKNCI